MIYWQFLGKCRLHLNVTHPIFHRTKFLKKKDKVLQAVAPDCFKSCFQNKPMWVEPSPSLCEGEESRHFISFTQTSSGMIFLTHVGR